ncbi:MAG: LysR family transcriptional regulator [Natronospirillum sp.]|uniref:LysR family transcriptional regulator n=1 Tax=Natronospirillum sp. TaxID=2812955 RepID=UPI0025DE0654|nr:LysR substrate-binding domain-containing protein [Natronospirillum sp.]MCH8550364.1 LysR family transcriptional regulator [Natronospirillum sp.]
MDTELLKAFVAVTETGGFSAAGKLLHRTQSAVSLQIKRLEDRMGEALFRRTSRQVVLTPAGGRLLPYARHILKLHDEAIRVMGAESPETLIRLGITEEQAIAYLPELLGRFAREYPHVRIEVICEASSLLVRDFQDGLLDAILAIRHTPTQSGQLLGREPLVWVASAEHPLPRRDPLPLALNPEGCIYRANAFAALGREEIHWDVRYTSQSPTGINLPVQLGLAATVKTPRSIPKNCRIIGPEAGLPALGHVETELHRSPSQANNEAFNAFCELLVGIVTHADNLEPMPLSMH